LRGGEVLMKFRELLAILGLILSFLLCSSYSSASFSKLERSLKRFLD
jgi:hypothetical protein